VQAIVRREHLGRGPGRLRRGRDQERDEPASVPKHDMAEAAALIHAGVTLQDFDWTIRETDRRFQRGERGISASYRAAGDWVREVSARRSTGDIPGWARFIPSSRAVRASAGPARGRGVPVVREFSEGQSSPEAHRGLRAARARRSRCSFAAARCFTCSAKVRTPENSRPVGANPYIVGGGVKWYANNRWGLRADYRFISVQSTDTAPAFFGQNLRYGHRVYGGVIINAGRCTSCPVGRYGAGRMAYVEVSAIALCSVLYSGHRIA
jgi:hypothetical protein